MAGSICVAILHVCRLRATRLDTLGNPVGGYGNAYVSDNIVQLQIKAVVEAGSDQTLKGGCDQVIASYKGPDKLKRLDLELDQGKLEPALEEMLLGAPTIVQGGKSSGNWYLGQNSASAAVQPNVALEVWSEARSDDHLNVAPFSYLHWLFPSTSWQIGDRTLQNDWTQPKVNGFTRSNPNWGLGIYGDQPEAAPSAAEFGVWATPSMPTAFCDYITEGLT